MAQLNVTSVPWIDSGDAPPLALDRDKRDIISQGIADPLVDYDIVPLTYTNSRWSAFFYRVDEAALGASCRSASSSRTTWSSSGTSTTFTPVSARTARWA